MTDQYILKEPRQPAERKCSYEELEAKYEAIFKAYDSLIYEVTRVEPGQCTHDLAKRYIREHQAKLIADEVQNQLFDRHAQMMKPFNDKIKRIKEGHYD